jgi:hypothetical protein
MREVHRFIADSILLTNRTNHGEAHSGAQAGTHGTQDRGGSVPDRLVYGGFLSGACSATTSPYTTAKPEAGGMLRFALPEYRLPKQRAGA